MVVILIAADLFIYLFLESLSKVLGNTALFIFNQFIGCVSLLVCFTKSIRILRRLYGISGVFRKLAQC